MLAKVRIVYLLENVPYSRNFGAGSLATLANEHNFAKLKQSKCHMHFMILYQFDNLLCQNIYQINYHHQTLPLYSIHLCIDGCKYPAEIMLT